MKFLVTGGAGYIGSHFADYLINKEHEVVVIDNLISGKPENINNRIKFYKEDIRSFAEVKEIFGIEKPEIVFHLAAVSRTPWAVENPVYTVETNEMGSVNVLEASKQAGVKKVVIASSNIVYAGNTGYRTSKLAMESWASVYNELYNLPTVCLRFSNVAGGKVERQHPENVLASLAKSKKEKGYIEITGDGEQTRNFTNVNDICEALYKAAGFHSCLHQWSYKGLEGEAKECLKCGDVRIISYNEGGEELDGEDIGGLNHLEIRGTEIDIMHPKTWSLNEIAKFFDCPVKYVPDRKGDIKHLKMGIGPEKAKELLGFEAKIGLEDYVKLYTEELYRKK